MYKKFLWTSVTLAFLWGTNGAMGMDHDERTPISHVPPAKVMVSDTAPGRQAWLDMKKNEAPSSVRRAADALWAATKLEGEAALNNGQGFYKGDPDQDIFCCFYTCGIYCCIKPCLPTPPEPQFDQQLRLAAVGSSIVLAQRTKELMATLEEFKNIVNGSVVQPEHYSGDAEICTLGPWVEDGAWTKDKGSLCSGRRDLSAIPGSTVKFVNLHGGWTVYDNSR